MPKYAILSILRRYIQFSTWDSQKVFDSVWTRTVSGLCCICLSLSRGWGSCGLPCWRSRWRGWRLSRRRMEQTGVAQRRSLGIHRNCTPGLTWRSIRWSGKLQNTKYFIICWTIKIFSYSFFRWSIRRSMGSQAWQSTLQRSKHQHHRCIGRTCLCSHNWNITEHDCLDTRGHLSTYTVYPRHFQWVTSNGFRKRGYTLESLPISTSIHDPRLATAKITTALCSMVVCCVRWCHLLGEVVLRLNIVCNIMVIILHTHLTTWYLGVCVTKGGGGHCSAPIIVCDHCLKWSL